MKNNGKIIYKEEGYVGSILLSKPKARVVKKVQDNEKFQGKK